jgi:hypothetical protein
MSIAVTCPSGHLLKIADNMAGRAGRCPFCREIVHVPALGRPAEGEKSTLASRSRLGRGPAGQGAPPSSAPPSGSPLSKSPLTSVPAALAPDPAAADTILMPISLSEMPPPDDIAFAGQASAAEPDSPVVADAGADGVGLDQMAQTLPLPTAELMPKRPLGAPEPAHDIGVDTAGHKARIIGSWKVLGDVEPPYVPEPTATRAPSAAVAASVAARTGPPPLPPANPTVATPDRERARRGSDDSSGAVAPKTLWLRHPIAKGSVWPLHATAYRIAVGLTLVSLFSMWPALRYWDLGAAPGWARGVLLVALLQLAYAAWLVSIPDWASLWGMMFVLAIVATMYGTAAAMTLATPMEHEPPLGLQSVRHIAPYWCCCVMLLTISTAYLCGHAAQRIRHAAGKN